MKESETMIPSRVWPSSFLKIGESDQLMELVDPLWGRQGSIGMDFLRRVVGSSSMARSVVVLVSPEIAVAERQLLPELSGAFAN